MTIDNAESNPPPFEVVNAVELVSETDSKITGVSVYSQRAEVTRVFKFEVKTGQNQVTITGLPSAMDQGSFRVEGRGSATIHDVTISCIPAAPPPKGSPKLEELEGEMLKTTKALSRARIAISSIETYMSSVKPENVDVSKLQIIVDNYEATAEKLDDRIAELNTKKKQLQDSIEEEKTALFGPQRNEKLTLKAVIGVFANLEGEVEIALIYAVRSASWSAEYDIRVDMDTKEKPVTLVYKGAITQNTGEDWTDVPLSLETAAPTFGVGIPSLSTWTLSVYVPPAPAYRKSKGGILLFSSNGRRETVAPTTAAPAVPAQSWAAMQTYDPTIEDSYVPMVPEDIQHRNLEVSSKGNISATFSVPGLMTIPSDNVAHNVTIVKLELDADMEWVSVPKRETKVHLKAVVKNTSGYTLLQGPASVYVDGSFISRSNVPPVSPDETFDCPLGLDPSIRITYPALAKKTAQSGFMSKSRVYNYTQRITLHNTKSSAVTNVKIIDQIPVSEDSTIAVKLLSPSLHLPDKSTGAGNAASRLIPGQTVENKLGVKVPAPVSVAKGVTAQWEGVDEVGSETDLDDLGGDGKLAWNCTIPAQGKLNLTLQWEVSAPLKTPISGL
ncbi:mucoidy inhibitor A [Coprinopsis cinerea okayama7|uniref:Mucoidy inhibitor A n=1 Tax=Coprinopsis cinerea (strain Okayama-7 / 130 / ATCC MYA-4618 / FGSC 9003) TaxID=240176 RepID=A8PES9_COPC7|nr:mucoidy inhibitor A [Coprinopsis cinerea okayama7\|eukprot:XP_001840837.1 mucoidy inhibitor A [Coprinopsis cinerea okayama7\